MLGSDHQSGQHRAAVVGAAGYTGQELVRFVLAHPRLTLAGVFGSGDGPEMSYADRCPAFRELVDEPVQPGTAEAILASGASIALLATPHEASAHLAPKLLDAGIHVFDLSAAFRLPSAAAYPVHYGFEHPAPGLLAEAVYGLPELNRESIAAAGEPALIAVPGCYPTAAMLPLAPLVRAGVVDASSVPIINAVSGISGAGRKATEGSQFCEVSLKPYGVLSHRHSPEIEAHAGIACSFVPHVGPFDRGIVATTHVQIAAGVSLDDAADVVRSAHTDELFVRLLPDGVWPSVAGVVRTNFCDIAIAGDERAHRLVLCSAIDNLVKGAAGQAIQCVNVVLGVDERLGLLAMPEADAAGVPA